LILLRTLRDLVKERNIRERKAVQIGFVPTMGALHEGHLSLVRQALKDRHEVWVSIFVNPLQFGANEDLKKYPRDFKKDSRLLKKAGVSVLYAPNENSFYPVDFQTEVRVKSLSAGLCGAVRPAHFAGVATVVSKLLMQVRPHKLYLGQKDFQQCRVIEQMITDLDMPVRVRRCPIVREKDGLAMSSRNVFLSPSERVQARVLYQALNSVQRGVDSGQRDAFKLKNGMLLALKNAPSGVVDYAEIVDASTLAPMIKLRPSVQVLAAVAVRFSAARLIDNILLDIV
jgi:pantoate--beta-alanine ligase